MGERTKADAVASVAATRVELLCNRRAAKLSPGAFVLAQGLPARWAGRGGKSVAHCGATDSVKVLLEPGRHGRPDFAFVANPTSAGAGELRCHLQTERLAHDAGPMAGPWNRIGLRRLCTAA